MDTSIIFNIIMVLGGLGLFLIGMKPMGEGLELAAGNKLRIMLQKITSNKFIAMLVGVLVTAVIQSSSATDAMVVGFVNAGLMDIYQSIGILFGSKIGTTVTSLILSFDIKAYVPLFTFAGALVITFAKKNNYRYYGLCGRTRHHLCQKEQLPLLRPDSRRLRYFVHGYGDDERQLRLPEGVRGV